MNRELKHYGIPGQKWGDRRFQYTDGSLTPAGRIRYGVEERTKAQNTNSHTSYKAVGMRAAQRLSHLPLSMGGGGGGGYVPPDISEEIDEELESILELPLDLESSNDEMLPIIATKPPKSKSNRPISSKKHRTKTVYWSKIGDDGNTYYYNSPVDPTIYYNTLHYGTPKSPYHIVNKMGNAGQKAMTNIMNNRRHRHYNK